MRGPVGISLDEVLSKGGLRTSYPLAEQTAVAADCIKECTAYLDKLKEFYLEALGAQNEQMKVVGGYGVEWEYDNTEGILDSITTLTESVAKLVDRLPVGNK